MMIGGDLSLASSLLFPSFSPSQRTGIVDVVHMVTIISFPRDPAPSKDEIVDTECSEDATDCPSECEKNKVGT